MGPGRGNWPRPGRPRFRRRWPPGQVAWPAQRPPAPAPAPGPARQVRLPRKEKRRRGGLGEATPSTAVPSRTRAAIMAARPPAGRALRVQWAPAGESLCEEPGAALDSARDLEAERRRARLGRRRSRDQVTPGRRRGRVPLRALPPRVPARHSHRHTTRHPGVTHRQHPPHHVTRPKPPSQPRSALTHTRLLPARGTWPGTGGHRPGPRAPGTGSEGRSEGPVPVGGAQRLRPQPGTASGAEEPGVRASMSVDAPEGPSVCLLCTCVWCVYTHEATWHGRLSHM